LLTLLRRSLNERSLFPENLGKVGVENERGCGINRRFVHGLLPTDLTIPGLFEALVDVFRRKASELLLNLLIGKCGLPTGGYLSEPFVEGRNVVRLPNRLEHLFLIVKAQRLTHLNAHRC